MTRTLDQVLQDVRAFVLGRLDACQLHRLGENHLDMLAHAILITWAWPLEQLKDAHEKQVMYLQAVGTEQVHQRRTLETNLRDMHIVSGLQCERIVRLEAEVLRLREAPVTASIPLRVDLEL